VLLADDDRQGGDPGDPCTDGLQWTHVLQTTQLDQFDTPLHMDREYVYLHTFTLGPGNTRPGARTQLFKDLNAGTSLFNYVGHGSPFKMTDEGVFLDTDAGTLTNGLRLSLLVSASCDVGKFNDPSVASLGEGIFTSLNGGCIGSSATEQALRATTPLNGLIYDSFSDRDTVTGGRVPAEWASTTCRPAALPRPSPNPRQHNSQKYQLMGDPRRSQPPRQWAEFAFTTRLGRRSRVSRGRRSFDGQV
jgi:hypothetical protein